MPPLSAGTARDQRLSPVGSRLMNSANVVVNRPAAEAGLALLNAGGDFADGVVAYEGSWLGADTFVSFDKKAAKLMEAQGEPVLLLSSREAAPTR